MEAERRLARDGKVAIRAIVATALCLVLLWGPNALRSTPTTEQVPADLGAESLDE